MKTNFAIFRFEGNAGDFSPIPINTWHSFKLFAKHLLEVALESDVSPFAFQYLPL